MNIDDLIEKEFKDISAAKTSGELLFEPKYALVVVDKIEQLEGVILGFNFWKLCEDGDFMEVNSTNWSNINKGKDASKETIKESRVLLKEDLPNEADYVGFVLRDQEI